MKKFEGIIPAFYACYNETGDVNLDTTKEMVEYLISQKVSGLYVCGSSGECIYLSVEERKRTLEAVVEQNKGRVKIIAHVACNNTKDSVELAKHAEMLGVDAIASIPPIYFKLPENAIYKYWSDMSKAAPNTDFIIYNIPQLAGVSLSKDLLKKMLENKRVIGVKNSSMPVMDIQTYRSVGGLDFMVLNGPDEQLLAGLAIGADGGIGGTYGVMPELFVKLYDLFKQGELEKANQIQDDILKIIEVLVSGKSGLYAIIKEVIKLRIGIDLGGVRLPLLNLQDNDIEVVNKAKKMIEETIEKYC